MRRAVAIVSLIVSLSTAALANPADPLEAEISTADVVRFFRIYDAAHGRPDAAALQGYIDQGSDGVRDFVPDRILSAGDLAAEIVRSPQVYADARACAANLGDVETRVRAAFLALKQLYPAATFPRTYILIGRNNSGGTATAASLMIGLEVVCRSHAPDPAPLDVRLTHLIAHEQIHSQQTPFEADTLLAQSLVEGAADFLAEFVSDRVSNPHLREWTKGKEAEIEQRFAQEMYGKNLKTWLYNGLGTPEAPGDLGYWVGCRIVRAYYERATDKRQAIKDILTMTEPRAFLAASGWKPAAR